MFLLLYYINVISFFQNLFCFFFSLYEQFTSGKMESIIIQIFRFIQISYQFRLIRILD